ncbi:MAG: hypothetical protein KJP01_02515, partial [Gramella sp.]|nr:hypothetical protein [Christiangramia sp.]
GRLVKSVVYDKYPTRVLKEITFSEYSSNNLEVKITVDNYAYFLSTPKVYRYYYSMILNQDLSINTIINEEGISYSFDELDAQKWVTKLGYIIPDGAKLWTTNYDYDQNGNVILYTSTYYDRDSQDASVVYSYADSGNPGTYQFNNEEGNYSYVEYFYRADNTLERMEESFNWGDGDKGKKIFIYTEEEAFFQQLTEFENGAKEIVDYDHMEGVIVEEHYGVEGGITNIYISLLNEDVYYLSTHEIYENGILVAKEFFNTENLLFKKEFYDPNGELEYTEYYDEDGNLTNTEYP